MVYPSCSVLSRAASISSSVCSRARQPGFLFRRGISAQAHRRSIPTSAALSPHSVAALSMHTAACAQQRRQQSLQASPHSDQTAETAETAEPPGGAQEGERFGGLVGKCLGPGGRGILLVTDFDGSCTRHDTTGVLLGSLLAELRERGRDAEAAEREDAWRRAEERYFLKYSHLMETELSALNPFSSCSLEDSLSQFERPYSERQKDREPEKTEPPPPTPKPPETPTPSQLHMSPRLDNPTQPQPSARKGASSIAFWGLMERLDSFETQMLQVVSEERLLRGISRKGLHRFMREENGNAWALRPRCLQTLRRLLDLEAKGRDVSTRVLSINWSSDLVGTAFREGEASLSADSASSSSSSSSANSRRQEAAGEDAVSTMGLLKIACNDVDLSDEERGHEGDGRIELRCSGPLQKLWVLAEMRRDAEERRRRGQAGDAEGKRPLCIYIGDTATDVPALLAADVGILILPEGQAPHGISPPPDCIDLEDDNSSEVSAEGPRAGGSLARLCDAFGFRLRPLSALCPSVVVAHLDEKEREARNSDGRVLPDLVQGGERLDARGPGHALRLCQSWRDIERFLFGSGKLAAP
uniref:Uncharacterized protein n=1 Tax=Chromera velia CCMP2878 TaxID=1169474 RepID=A0A0G4HVH9_9ALVE|eukprot:Cvel_8809.t1-p1 / transcript=Cvel_8809.t1 / gene=Cvel_8809 / organism=Chromera_velia_CCMP2878 / gene_product=hypothetical protein / transcript_product=hypothetical protein / location=Cvel_scaffold493:59504-64026(+) / protein_length=584 / sequence_SO=supercontig / SO=protein_coding / is_pseudo=false